MARLVCVRLASTFAVLLLTLTSPAQDPKPQEPPEEDELARPKDYTFNPLQAAKELKVGTFYARKGSHKAAALRFAEAVKWDPTLAEAWLKLGESYEKVNQWDKVREAYAKYLELVPSAKNAKDIRKRIEQAARSAAETGESTAKP